MKGGSAIRSHYSVLAIMIGGKFFLKSLDVVIVVPAIAHAIFHDPNLVFGNPRPCHVNRFHQRFPFRFVIDFAGIPITVVFSSTFCVTTAPAPTIESAPIVILGNTVAPAQTQTFTPAFTDPHSV